MVTILFPSLISRVIKENRTEVIAETLGEAIDKLIEKYGKQLTEIMFDSGELNRFLKFYIKGRNIPETDKMNAPLKPDDEIAILIIISGG